jgi:hypothetical protein
MDRRLLYHGCGILYVRCMGGEEEKEAVRNKLREYVVVAREEGEDKTLEVRLMMENRHIQWKASQSFVDFRGCAEVWQTV